MKKQWIVVASVVAVVVAFIAGAVVFKGRETQQVSQAAQSNSDALVRASSPVFGNPAAKVTIVEFFDPACETCRAFYPLVKTIVNSSFGQVRLVVRHAPLHEGSDTAVKILEAAKLQGQYWPAVERALAGQPRWAAHGNARPELIWDLITDLGLDMAKARSDANSPAVAQLLAQDVADMKALKVDRTPGFFVNGTPLREFGEAQLRALVDQEIKKVKAP
ncbi:MAG: disulfide bond formation protein DsbA [Burkholderiales bacterium 28-67-8]|nr:MAG: disulfide bond formation protein DsbA [Burkholderiales bacterium 28-67-8]